MLGLMRQRGRLAGVIVPRHRQHAAVGRGAEGIGVLEHIHAAIDTRPFAVPQAKNTVVARLAEQVGLLTAPHRRGREFFVNPRLKMHVVFFEPGSGPPERLVDAAQGRAPVAGDKRGGIEAAPSIALVLKHGQTHQRFDARHVSARGVQRVLVVQRDVVYAARRFGGVVRSRHGRSSRAYGL